jgi:hypothetical protein
MTLSWVSFAMKDDDNDVNCDIDEIYGVKYSTNFIKSDNSVDYKNNICDNDFNESCT